MDIGAKIKEIRQNSLLSQVDFAKEIGVSFSTVNRWENNKTIPGYQALKKIKWFCERTGQRFDVDIESGEESS